MVCRVWRFKVAPKLQTLIDEAAKCEDCSSAWQGIELKQLDVESPEAMNKLRNHAIDHVETCAGCPAMLTMVSLVEQLDSWTTHLDNWSWHWWHAHKLQEEAAQMLDSPRQRVLYIEWDYQEIVGVPMCPVESSPMYYANNTLALNTLGALCWWLQANGTVHKEWRVFVTRVMDRSAAFTVCQLRSLLDEMDKSLFDEIQIISDCGTHFRSYFILGSYAEFVLQDNRHWLQTINVFWRAEGHSKNPMDRLFSDCARQKSGGGAAHLKSAHPPRRCQRRWSAL
jgi:hypothetical protein